MTSRDGPRRSVWGVLTDSVFGPYLAAKLVTAIGQWGHNVLSAILAFELTSSAFVVGTVVAAQFVPQLVLTPLSGALADRIDRRRQVIAGRLIAAGGSAMLATWTSIVGIEGLPGAGPLILASAIVGVGHAIDVPATHALLPSMVRRDELDVAVTLHTLPLPIGRAAGPIAGVLLAQTIGPAYTFALAAAANLALVMVMRRLPRSGPVPIRDAAAPKTVLSFLRQDRRSQALLLGVASLGIGTDPSITLSPPLSQALVGDTSLVGAMATAFGCGAGAGFVLIPLARRWMGLQRYGTSGLALLTVSGLGLLFAATPAMAIAAFAVAGSGLTIGLTGLSATLQLRVPDSLRGRIMALWSIAFMGSRPFAALVNGTLADLLGLAVALGTITVGLAVATWWCWRSDRRHRPDGGSAVVPRTIS